MTHVFPFPGLPPLFDLSGTEHPEIFAGVRAPWEVVAAIASLLEELLDGRRRIRSPVPDSVHMGPLVHMGEGCVVEPGVCILGPAWIGDGCVLRQGLYIRENVIAGSGSTLGHACEIKNSLLFREAQVPHFNYVGDSVLGYRAHIGAGVILSNVRLDRGSIRIPVRGERIDTGLDKLGALLGDGCEVGCNTVLNPGTVLGAGSVVAPLSSVRGVHPAGSRIGK